MDAVAGEEVLAAAGVAGALADRDEVEDRPDVAEERIVALAGERPRGAAVEPPRLEASNFAVYSDAVNPVTTAIVDPAPNANGWNRAAVSVSLGATDLASGLNDTRRDGSTCSGYAGRCANGAQTSCPDTRLRSGRSAGRHDGQLLRDRRRRQ